MKKASITTLLFIITSTLVFAQLPQDSLKGQWKFDDSSNLVKATVGNDLILEALTGVTASQQAVEGPISGDGAVSLPKGVFYRCNHDIASNGGGTKVNQYTLVFDFKKPVNSTWSTFFGINADASADDWECFINTTNNIGVGLTGYSTDAISINEWYRLVIVAKLGTSYDYYLDGKLILAGGAQELDGRFAISPSTATNQILFLGDNDGDDDPIDVAQIALYNRSLTAAEVAQIGGFHAATDVENFGQMPDDFSLGYAYPNPFNPVTNIQFAIPVASTVKLIVYNIQGAEVATLLNGNLSAGTHQVQWNSSNNLNGAVSSGVYFYRLSAQSADGKSFSQSKKVIFIK